MIPAKGSFEQSSSEVVEAHPTDDLVVIGKMRLALLAAIDPLRVEVDVVGEAHLDVSRGWALAMPGLLG